MQLPINPGPNRSMIHPNPTPAAGGPIRLIAPEPVNPGYYKSLVLDVLGVLAALALGYSYYAYLAFGLSLWFSFAAFLIFGTLSALQVLLQKKSNRRACAILGETLAFMAWFAYVDVRILAPVAVAMFVLLWWGYLRGRSELAYTTEIRFFRATHRTVGKAATATVIAMILFYLGIASGGIGAAAGSAGASGLFVSRADFQPFYHWAAGAFNSFYPGIFLDGSFGQFAQSVVQKDLQSNPAYQDLSVATQASTTAAATTAFTDNFSTRLGVPITSSTMAVDVFYGSIVDGLQYARNKLQEWFFTVWVVAVFILLRAIGIAIVWITEVFALIIYETLLSSGFMKIIQHPDVKEEIEY